MDQKLEDEISRKVFRILSRVKVPDPVGLTERIVDVVVLMVDMRMEESGIGSISTEDAWDLHEKQQQVLPEIPRFKLPPLPHGVVVEPDPAAREKSSLVLPGDREFKMPTPPPARVAITAKPVKRKAPGKKGQFEREYWEIGDLQQHILEGTPETVSFETIDRNGRPVAIEAIRNTHCEHGIGNVALTYRHPSVSEDAHAGNPAVSANIPLVAKVSFSVYEQEHSLDQAMESIQTQLRGLYKPRAERMVPYVVDPGPLRIDMANQPGDYENTRMQSGHTPTRTFADDPGDTSHLNSVIERNKSNVGR